MVSTKKTCSICLETTRKSIDLNLNCQCKYAVHFKCYNKWWKSNHCCIICHTPSPKPTRKIFRTPIRNRIKRVLVEKINNRRNERRNMIVEFSQHIQPNEITFILQIYTQIILKIFLYIVFFFIISSLINANIR